MKTWKRVLALLLALAMVFALAACGSSSDDEDDDDYERPSARRESRRSGGEESSEERGGGDPFGGFPLPGLGQQASGKPAEETRPAAAAEAPEEKPAETPAAAETRPAAAEAPEEKPAETPAAAAAEAPVEAPAEEKVKVALIVWGDLETNYYAASLNEGFLPLVRESGITYTTYETPDFADMEPLIRDAVDSGASFVVGIDIAFLDAAGAVAADYPDVCFICVDWTKNDLYMPNGGAVPPNVSFVQFREEQAGFLAGYAAVRLGYKKLGFLGGMAVPAVVRYGIGFVQGADAAAEEFGISGVSVKYAYANQFYGDADITDAMDGWYAEGTEVVFACGGAIYTSVGEAAAKAGGRVIGIDIDQKAEIDGLYGEGVTLTSAVKNYGSALGAIVSAMQNGSIDGRTSGLEIRFGTGLSPEGSGVALADSTEFNAGFTRADYETLLYDVTTGFYHLSDDVSVAPEDWARVIDVQNYGNLK